MQEKLYTVEVYDVDEFTGDQDDIYELKASFHDLRDARTYKRTILEFLSGLAAYSNANAHIEGDEG